MGIVTSPCLIFTLVTCSLFALMLTGGLFWERQRDKRKQRFFLESTRLAVSRLGLQMAVPEKTKNLPPLPPGGGKWVVYDDCPWWRGKVHGIAVTLILSEGTVKVRLRLEPPFSTRIRVPSNDDSGRSDPFSEGYSVGPVRDDECCWLDDVINHPVITLKAVEQQVRELFEPPLGKDLNPFMQGPTVSLDSKGMDFDLQLFAYNAAKERNKAALSESIVREVRQAVDLLTKVRLRAGELGIA